MREPLSAQHLTWRNKLGRLVWQLVWLTLYRPSPTPLHAWRCWLLRLFGQGPLEALWRRLTYGLKGRA